MRGERAERHQRVVVEDGPRATAPQVGRMIRPPTRLPPAQPAARAAVVEHAFEDGWSVADAAPAPAPAAQPAPVLTDSGIRWLVRSCGLLLLGLAQAAPAGILGSILGAAAAGALLTLATSALGVWLVVAAQREARKVGQTPGWRLAAGIVGGLLGIPLSVFVWGFYHFAAEIFFGIFLIFLLPLGMPWFFLAPLAAVFAPRRHRASAARVTATGVGTMGAVALAIGAISIAIVPP